MGTGAEINVAMEHPQPLQLQYSDVVPLQFNGHSLDLGRKNDNAQRSVDLFFGSSTDLLANADEIAKADAYRPSPAEAAQELRKFGDAKVLSQPDARGEMMEWKDIQTKAQKHDREHPYVEASQTLPGPPPYHTDEYTYFMNEEGQAVSLHRHNNGGNGEPNNFVNVSATTALRLPNGDLGNATVRFDLGGNVIGVDLSVIRPTVPPSGYSVENVPKSQVPDLVHKVDQMEEPKLEPPKGRSV